MKNGIILIVFGIIIVSIGIYDLLGKSKTAYFPEKSLKQLPEKIHNPISKKLAPFTIILGVIIFSLGIVTLIIN